MSSATDFMKEMGVYEIFQFMESNRYSKIEQTSEDEYRITNMDGQAAIFTKLELRSPELAGKKVWSPVRRPVVIPAKTE